MTGETIYDDGALTLLADRDAEGRAVLVWRVADPAGAAPGEADGPPTPGGAAGARSGGGGARRGGSGGTEGADRAFLNLAPIGPGVFAAPALAPLRRVVERAPPGPGQALGLLASAAHLVADLHDAGRVFGLLNPDTLWVDAGLTEARLLPLGSMAEDALLDEAARRRFAARQPAAFRRPDAAPDGWRGGAAVADRGLDLFALGALCRWLTAAACPEARRGAEAGGGPVPAAIAARLSGEEEPRYATARGAALDLQECAVRLTEDGRITPFPLGRQDGAPRLAAPETLYGREPELAALDAALERARVGAAAVMVSGPPGVGKSRLVDVFEQRAGRRLTGVFRGKSDQLNANQPLSSLSRALDELARRVLDGPPRLQAAWRARLRRALDGDEAVVAALSPHLGALVGASAPPRALPPLEARNRFLDAARRLIRAFGRPRRPVCLFLDDLQWADEATVELLEALAGDPELAGLMVVGAWREADVGPDHPLARAVERHRADGHMLRTLRLGELGFDDAARLVAATVGAPVEEVAALTGIVQRLTRGNPFFIAQLLRSLVARRLMTFDFGARRWEWDPLRIAGADFDRDVVELLIDRLRPLDADCRRLLAHAALLGAEFTSALLREAMALPPDAPLPGLEDAIGESILIRRAEAGGALRFGHDRLQQAVLEATPPEAFAALRAGVGLNLVASPTVRADAGLLALALNNANAAAGGGHDRATRLELARLNLAAGRDAREKLSFAAALEKFEAGMRWLPEDAWATERALARDLHAEGFRAAYQTGALDRASALYDRLIADIDDPVEAAEAISTRVLLDTAAKRYETAFDVARGALARLGAPIPARITTAVLLREAAAIAVAMRGRRIAALADLPPMTDAASLRAVALLTNLLPVGYFLDPKILIFCGLRIVRTSLAKGNAPQSPSGYVILGLGLIGALERFETGRRWGRLAVDLARDGSELAVRGKALLIFAGFVNFWRAGFDESLALVEEARAVAMSAGDHQYACYAHIQRWQIGFFRAAPLDGLIADCRRLTRFVTQRGDPFEVESQAIWLRAFETLRGEAQGGDAAGGDGAGGDAALDDAAAYHARLEAIGNQTLIGYSFAMRAKLGCWFDRPEVALDCALRAMAMRPALPGILSNVDAEFYAGVAAAQLIGRGDGARRPLVRALRRARDRLALRARHAPMNFIAHRMLLDAEMEAVARGAQAALPAFDRAIRAAAEAGFADVAALAARRAGALAAAVSPRVAAGYAEEADAHLRAWGALALASGPDRERPAGPTARARAQAADAGAQPGAVVHALASPADDPERVAALMGAALREGGFERASFVLWEDGGPRVVATLSAGRLRWSARPGLDAAPEMREDLLDLARRTGREVMVGDLAADPRFRRAAGPEAAVAAACAPALLDGEIVGALHVSARAPRATPPPLGPALRLAAAEIARSLASGAARAALEQGRARLAAAERRIDELDAMRAELASFLPRALPGLLAGGGADRREERVVTTMFLDVQGYTALVEFEGADAARDLVSQRFSEFYDIIRRREGDLLTTIGDAIFAVFDGEDPAAHAGRAVAAAQEVAAFAAAMNARTGVNEPPLVVNIGVNTGPAVVGVSELGAGRAKRRTVEIVGTVVNVAARIAALARDGAVLIGGDTRRLLPETLAARPLGAQRLRNLAQPVEVFDVTPTPGAAAAFNVTTAAPPGAR